jgi:hypothetical protein
MFVTHRFSASFGFAEHVCNVLRYIRRKDQLFSEDGEMRFTETNLTRKRSSSVSRTSAGMRFTSSSSEGKGISAAVAVGVSPTVSAEASAPSGQT